MAQQVKKIYTKQNALVFWKFQRSNSLKERMLIAEQIDNEFDWTLCENVFMHAGATLFADLQIEESINSAEKIKLKYGSITYIAMKKENTKILFHIVYTFSEELILNGVLNLMAMEEPMMDYLKTKKLFNFYSKKILIDNRRNRYNSYFEMCLTHQCIAKGTVKEKIDSIVDCFKGAELVAEKIIWTEVKKQLKKRG